MGMTRISSDGSLPNSNWKCFSPSTDVSWIPLVPANQPRMAQKALFVGPTNMPGWYDLRIEGGVFARITAGTSYVLEAAHGTTFDLSKIQGLSSDGMDASILCIYQP